jgi:hypothetical protein
MSTVHFFLTFVKFFRDVSIRTQIAAQQLKELQTTYSNVCLFIQYKICTFSIIDQGELSYRVGCAVYPPFGKQTKSTWDPAVSFCQTHKHHRIPCWPTFTLLALFSCETTSSTKYYRNFTVNILTLSFVVVAFSNPYFRGIIFVF